MLHQVPRLFAIALILIPGLANGIPVEHATLGSTHNIYLATCESKGTIECSLLIFCGPGSTQTYTAAAYFPNGSIQPGRREVPTQMGTVADPAAPWEGTQRVTRLGQSSAFASNINAGADALPAGQLAGAAKLDSEDFACFTDRETHFSGPNFDCTADYWCASTQVTER